MPYCDAPGCNNTSEKQKVDNVKGYHDVPNEGELRKKWIAALKSEPPYPPPPPPPQRIRSMRNVFQR